jgi:hypothetical protein
MKFRITVETRAFPEDPCPDVGSEELEFPSIEIAWERAREVEAATNSFYEDKGLPVRGRILEIEEVS